MIYQQGETHPREILERKARCIFLVELAKSDMYRFLGVGPKHELRQKDFSC